MRYKLIKREHLEEESKSPFYELVQDTVENGTKNPMVFYNQKGERIIVRGGERATFRHYVERKLGNKTVRLEKTPKWRQV